MPEWNIHIVKIQNGYIVNSLSQKPIYCKDWLEVKDYVSKEIQEHLS